MTKFAGGILATGIIAVGLTASSLAERGSEQSARSSSAVGRGPVATAPAVRMTPAHARVPMTVDAQKALVGEYCLGCHDRGSAKGELVLEEFDLAHPERNASIAEKVIRKLRAGMMPPPGEERPEAGAITAFAASLESRIDQFSAAHPNPGRRTFQRLNRAEYAHSIREMLGLDVDVAAFLPPDTISHNFDNIADVQTFSPTLLEGYLRAATRISRDAVGDPGASPSSYTYRVARTASQLRHVDGAPFGTRGGISVVHTFPADGEYTFRMMLHSIPTGQLYGSTLRGDRELLEVSIDGERAAVLEINPRMSEADPNGMNVQTPPVAIKAGPRRVSAAFVQRWDGPVDDLVAPIEHTLADTQIGSAIGITTVPHLRDLAIVGPQRVTGVSETPVRRRIFTCRPTSPEDETPCATKIVSELARRAYRRPITPDDLKGVMRFYHQARKDADFEAGIRTALQAILASPHFIFRLEEAPAGVKTGQNYRIGDLDLASRLSFFLWSTPPDDELVAAAVKNGLQNPVVLEKQVRRMLADPRAAALATRFASQWLRLQDLEKLHPEPLLYPQYDRTLAESMVRETELFFEHLVREDRSLLELLTADYTFVNERLARHYGIPNVVGGRFQRVSLAGDPIRRGILGQGSILAMTSVADRTSPVLRGKWVLEVLFGMPPPPPPDDVPDLEATKGSNGTRLLSVRERLEEHRKSKACQSCHRVIDPLGLALENFDVTGAWRIRDNGTPVDPSGQLYDGTPLNGPAALRDALLKRSDVVLKTFSENLMAYALGRRIEPYDMPTIRSFVRDAAANGHRFSAFVLGVVRSPAFQMARADVEAAEAAESPRPAPSSASRSSRR